MPTNININTNTNISTQSTPTIPSIAQDPSGASKSTRSRTLKHGASVTAAQQHMILLAVPYGSVPQTEAWSISLAQSRAAENPTLSPCTVSCAT
jgi:hypothetical protein